MGLSISRGRRLRLDLSKFALFGAGLCAILEALLHEIDAAATPGDGPDVRLAWDKAKLRRWSAL